MARPELPAKPVKQHIDNTELVTRFRAEGGGLFHIRPRRHEDRGMTVAFKLKNSRLTFSTAVQHRSDSFTKKIGTKTAIEHFDAGQTVTIPITKRQTSELIEMLSYGLGMVA